MKNDNSLLYACWINDLELIKENLKTVKASHLKQSTQETGTPLHAVALHGNTVAIDLLLGAGVNIEQGNFLNNNAMLTCIENGKLDTAKYLIEKGSDVNRKGVQGRSGLNQLILYSWDKDFAEYLLAKGSLINATAQDKQSLLEAAAALNNTDAMHFLFENGIDKSYINKAMNWAITYNSTAAVRAFLEMGADINEMYSLAKGIEKAIYHDLLSMDNRGSRIEMIGLLFSVGVDFKLAPNKSITLGLDKTKLSPYEYAVERKQKYPGLDEFISAHLSFIDQLIEHRNKK